MENKEIEIRVPDILAAFLKSICLIVAATIFFGALLGAYGYYKARHTVVDTSYEETITAVSHSITEKETTIRNLQARNQTLTDYNLPYYTRKLENDTQLSERRRSYLENSYYYSIDPFNCGTARITFAVDAPIPEGAAQEYASYKANEQRRIVNACAAMTPFSDEVIENVRKILNIDAEKRFVEELITVTNVEDQFVRLDVYFSDPALAQKAADYLFTEMCKIVNELDPEYQVNVVSSFNGSIVNWEMYEERTMYEDSLLASEKNMAADNDSINTLNKTIEDNTVSIDAANIELTKLKHELEAAQNSLKNANQSTSAKKNVIKFGLVGCVFGLIVSCVYVYVTDIFSGKIRSRNNVISRFPYPLLGVVPSQKKRLFNKTIKKLEGDPLYPDKDVTAATAANTLAIATKDDAACAMIGTISKEDPSLLTLKEAMHDKIRFSGNILSDAKTVSEIEKCSKVILVEKRNVSRLDSVSEEIEKLRSLNKEILGIILL